MAVDPHPDFQPFAVAAFVGHNVAVLHSLHEMDFLLYVVPFLRTRTQENANMKPWKVVVCVIRGGHHPRGGVKPQWQTICTIASPRTLNPSKAPVQTT